MAEYKSLGRGGEEVFADFEEFTLMGNSRSESEVPLVDVQEFSQVIHSQDTDSGYGRTFRVRTLLWSEH